MIKHDGHSFEPDVEGTDSFRIRKAGAEATAVFCETHAMVIMEKKMTEKDLMQLFPDVDLILLEGFKNSTYPKIEILRRENSKKLVCKKETLLAVASDYTEAEYVSLNSEWDMGEEDIVWIGLSEYERAAELIMSWVSGSVLK